MLIRWKLSLFLACVLAATVYAGIRLWERTEAERERFDLAVSPILPSPDAPDLLRTPTSQDRHEYENIVLHNLFASDRNPVVASDPPAPKPIPNPPLPVAFGVVTLGGSVHVFMAEGLGGTQKAIGVHDTIGEFFVVALDPERIVFEWRGENLTYPIADLMHRPEQPDRTRVNFPGNDQPAVVAIAQLEATVRMPDRAGPLGREVGVPGASRRECVNDDPSPAGTLVGGYRKLIVNNPFGTACSWTMAH